MSIWSDIMFFLAAGQSPDYLLLIIIAITIILIGVVVFYFITNTKKKSENTPKVNANFETKQVEQIEEKVLEKPVEQIERQPIEVNEEIQTQEQIALEDEKTSTNIASLLEEMQKDLDNTEEQVEKYEAEQEENAIISYKELMRIKAEREKSLVLEEKEVEEIKEVIKLEEPKKEEVKKFKRSEFISPIFGFNEGTNVTYREIKRPPRKEEKSNKNYDEWESDKLLKKLEDDSAEVIEVEEHEIEKELSNPEAKRNDNFLEALVDFRNKLD